MIDIYYYSGTGFTLKAAKILKERLTEEVRLIPIASTGLEHQIVSRTTTIGLLMPMHAFGMPIAFEQFMKKFRCPNADYVFSIVTRGGAPTRIHKQIEKYLKKNDKNLNAFKYATAPNTFDIIFEIHSNKEMLEARENFEQDIEMFANVVNCREQKIDLSYRNHLVEFILFPILRRVTLITGYFKLQNDFYVDDKCTSCGQCEAMCLSGKIKLKEGKPVWVRDIQCQYCLACLHLCPSKAIQIRKTKTHKMERMYHPEVKCKDIAKQKKPLNQDRI